MREAEDRGVGTGEALNEIATGFIGEWPEFKERFARLRESVRLMRELWTGETTNFEGDYARVEELTTSAAIETCAYVLANPCKHDLVVKGKDWRGLTSVNLNYGDKISVLRPSLGLWKHLDNPKKKERKRKKAVSRGREKRMGRCKLAAILEIELKPLPFPYAGSPAQMRQAIFQRLEQLEDKAEAKRVKAGRKVLGMRRVLEQDWRDQPRNREDLFGPVPKAAGTTWKKIEHAVRNSAFIEEHEACRLKALAGEQPVFPAGTWAMVRRYGYACASP